MLLAKMEKITREEEQELLKRCLKGDEEALEEFVRLFEKQVFNLAYRLSGDRDSASDIAHQALLRALGNLKSFRGESSLATWLYRITINVFYDYAKKGKREISYDQMEVGEEGERVEIADEEMPLEEVVEREEVRRIVQREIACLPEYYRVVLVLYDIEGLSYAEICDMLKCPLGTVKSRLNRARLMLKERLERYRELLE